MRRYAVQVGGRTHTIDVDEITAERFRVRVSGHEFELTLSHAEEIQTSPLPPAIAAPPRVPSAAPAPLAPPPLPHSTAPPLAAEGGPPEVRAPMPGTVVSVEVQPGAVVKRGDTLVRLEAMKMINHVRAHREGVVAEVKATAGRNAAFGEVLVTFEQDEG